MISLGVTTFNRPEFAEKCLKAIARHLPNVKVYIHDDGSDSKHAGSYKRAFRAVNDATLQLDPINRGVAASKNALLGAMLEDGAEWLILCEDDIKVISPQAVTGYLEVAEKSGLHHLSFAHHGPVNEAVPLDADENGVAYFPHAIGAWCLYSRECLERCGLFDETLVNAWEHVEHSLRLAMAGYTTGPFRWADAANSRLWLAELPGAIEKSSIRPRLDWNANIVNGLHYWRTAKPESFDVMFGPASPLHEYARNLLGAQ